MARATTKRYIRCYLCGFAQEVSARTMSTTCPSCHKAIKVEDVVIKSYLPVNDLQTCGKIKITKRGRVAARRIQSGEGIVCEGSMEGTVETEGEVRMGPAASWKGKAMYCRWLHLAEGASIDGVVEVPWSRCVENTPLDHSEVAPRRLQADTPRTDESDATHAPRKKKVVRKKRKKRRKVSATAAGSPEE
ncbi:MAG: polymer-forming cytoskeletal protein [Planctomycetota bacterium]|jgi:hypothetical protein